MAQGIHYYERDPPTPSASNGIENHEINEAATDVVVYSSDKVTFHLHSANIEVQAGAFPSWHTQPQSLPEPASVLTPLFKFLYPQDIPTLSEVNFETVMAILTAAERYQIYSAINVSLARLRDFLPQNPAEILSYAIKSGYPNLIDEAALLSARYPVHDILLLLPSHALAPWARYHEAWETVFESATKSLRLKSNATFMPVSPMCGEPGLGMICNRCQMCLIAWIDRLRKIDNLEDLEIALNTPKIQYQSGSMRCINAKCKNNSCEWLPPIKKIFEDGIKVMRGVPFGKFLAVGTSHDMGDVLQTTKTLIMALEESSFKKCTIQ